MSSIGDHIDSSQWDQVCSVSSSAEISYIEVNGYSFPVQNGVIIDEQTAGSTSVAEDIKNFKTSSDAVIESTIGAGALKIKEYLTPTKLALTALDDLGESFNKIIKDTFITQMFHIKGTDMLCAAFCIVVSFLDCNTRQSMYDAVQTANAIGNTATNVTSDVNEMVKTFNASMVSAETVAKAANGLFTGGLSSATAQQDTGMGLARAMATLQAAPGSVKDIIDSISNALKLVNRSKISLPIGITGRIWDLSSVVLFEMQATAVEIVDNAISTITNPVEDMIRDAQPTICIGGMAAVFFNRLIDIVENFKMWALNIVANLFTANNAASLEFTAFNQSSQSILELMAFLDSLSLLLSGFGDLALTCGVQPCNTSSPSSDVLNALQAGNNIPEPNTSAAIVSPDADFIAPSNNIETLAERIAPIIGGKESDVYVTPGKIIVSKPFMKDAPKMISDLLNSDEILKNLGPDYTIYKSADNKNATVVYSYNRACGSIGE